MGTDVATQKLKTTRKRRKRRPTEEIIDRILTAASDEFERNGYAGATTAAIAKQARVAEALIFSNFGSKEKLFRDSIFVPMNKHLLDFCAHHLVNADDPARSREKFRRKYVAELEQFIGKHSLKFISLFFAQVYGTCNGLDEIEGLQNYFSQASSFATEHLEGRPKHEPATMARISFATIFSCIVFRDWLFPSGMISDEKINAALTDFVLGGVDAMMKRK